MAIGPGKYDDVLTQTREQCGSTAAILIMFNGEHGAGFSCQADVKTLAVLRLIAQEIEDDQREGTYGFTFPRNTRG